MWLLLLEQYKTPSVFFDKTPLFGRIKLVNEEFFMKGGSSVAILFRGIVKRLVIISYGA